jgi:uncharacterized membrane protein
MNRKSTLKRGLKPTILTIMLFGGGFLVVLFVRQMLKPLASKILAADLVKASFFDLASYSLSLIVYLFLVVWAMRMWDEVVRRFLRQRYEKPPVEGKKV